MYSATRLVIRTILFFVTVCLSQLSAPASDAVAFVDGVGRTLQLPTEIKRIYTTSPVSAIMLYSLSPEKMVGWNYKLMPQDRPYILPAVRDLPVLGGWFGANGPGNREALLASQPQVILSIGDNDATAVDFADRLQQQMGIPVLVASGRLEDTAATYELLGKLCGNPERARELAAYCRKTLAEIQVLAASIPPEKRRRVYYAEGPRGLLTNVKHSMHAEALDLVGAENVAQGSETESFNRAAVSMEQVLAWQPDAMVICRDWSESPSPCPEWLDTAQWRRIPAVAEGHAWQIPGTPFNWFDRPPSANRFLGLKWLAWALYPDRFKSDIVAETREFYRLFYHFDLTEEAAKKLLDASRVRLPSAP